MTIADLERDLQICQEHLRKTNSNNSDIDTFLTQFMLVRICGEYEIEIKRSINNRVKKTGDSNLAKFVENKIDVRSILISDIKGNIIKPLSSDGGNSFDFKTKDTEMASRYNNIVENRNYIAHGTYINMTFSELMDSYNIAKGIIQIINEEITK